MPEESLEQTTMSIAQEFAQGPTVAHAATKELVHIAVNEGVAAADEAGCELLPEDGPQAASPAARAPAMTATPAGLSSASMRAAPAGTKMGLGSSRCSARQWRHWARACAWESPGAS